MPRTSSGADVANRGGRYRVAFIDSTTIQEDDPEDADAEQITIVASRFMILPSVIEILRFDGAVIDFQVHFFFRASSPAELRHETERILRDCGRDVEVFSVFDDAGNEVLTEETLWNSEPA